MTDFDKLPPSRSEVEGMIKYALVKHQNERDKEQRDKEYNRRNYRMLAAFALLVMVIVFILGYGAGEAGWFS